MSGWRNLVVAVVLLAGVAAVTAQGNYAAVTAKDLVEAKFNHYYDANMKAVSPADFSWKFTATNLTIQAGKGAIPPDLMGQLAAGMKEAKSIEAGWKVEEGKLVVSGIKVDGQPTRTLAKLMVHRTAPTVIRIGKHQYVFSPLRSGAAGCNWQGSGRIARGQRQIRQAMALQGKHLSIGALQASRLLKGRHETLIAEWPEEGTECRGMPVGHGGLGEHGGRGAAAALRRSEIE